MFYVKEESTRQLVCPHFSAGALTAAQVQDLKDKIDQRYRINMALDGMPITTADLEIQLKEVPLGFDVGYTDGYDHYVFNHLVFNVLIHEMRHDAAPSDTATSGSLDAAARRWLSWPKRPQDAESAHADEEAAGGVDPAAAETWVVVGFEVMPCSIKRELGDKVLDVRCKPLGALDNPEPQVIREGADIIYTYDVYFEQTSLEWSERWSLHRRDSYGWALASTAADLLVRLLIAALIFSLFVIVITLRRMFNRRNSPPPDSPVKMPPKTNAAVQPAAGN